MCGRGWWRLIEVVVEVGEGCSCGDVVVAVAGDRCRLWRRLMKVVVEVVVEFVVEVVVAVVEGVVVEVLFGGA